MVLVCWLTVLWSDNPVPGHYNFFYCRSFTFTENCIKCSRLLAAVSDGSGDSFIVRAILSLFSFGNGQEEAQGLAELLGEALEMWGNELLCPQVGLKMSWFQRDHNSVHTQPHSSVWPQSDSQVSKIKYIAIYQTLKFVLNEEADILLKVYAGLNGSLIFNSYF